MQNKPINVILIAYYFAPDKRVGALRMSYWYKELPKKMDCSLRVITANEESKGLKDVHVVPQTRQIARFNPIKDAGLAWRKDLQEYLLKHPMEADVIVLSGAPFMHFGLTGWLKERLGCRVILDYRDPFAENPGFNNNRFTVFVKKYVERRFNRKADGLLTVNNYCAELIQGFKSKPHAIVQNGFDETIEPMLKPVDLLSPRFSYTGKFYFDPVHLIEALDESEHSWDYAGPDQDCLTISERVVNHGLVDYKTAVNLIAGSDVGIIQTYGEDFQSTTKLFDYIRCKRAILIVSNKHLKRGSIHEELQKFPNVFWAKNSKQSILEAIEQLKASQYTEPDDDYCQTYSRGRQMLKLIHLIKQVLLHD